MVFFRAIQLLLAYMKRPRAEGYVAVLEHSAEKKWQRGGGGGGGEIRGNIRYRK